MVVVIYIYIYIYIYRVKFVCDTMMVLVMLLIVLYDSVMLVRMNWYTGDSVTTIRDDIAISIIRRVQRIIIPLHLPLLSRLLLL